LARSHLCVARQKICRPGEELCAQIEPDATVWAAAAVVVVVVVDEADMADASHYSLLAGAQGGLRSRYAKGGPKIQEACGKIAPRVVVTNSSVTNASRAPA